MSTETHTHHEHPDVVGSRNRLGVILILVADIAFALSILFVYFYLRGQNVNDMWLPAATAVSIHGPREETGRIAGVSAVAAGNHMSFTFCPRR